jgi:hypothetical protein
MCVFMYSVYSRFCKRAPRPRARVGCSWLAPRTGHSGPRDGLMHVPRGDVHHARAAATAEGPPWGSVTVVRGTGRRIRGAGGQAGQVSAFRPRWGFILKMRAATIAVVASLSQSRAEGELCKGCCMGRIDTIEAYLGAGPALFTHVFVVAYSRVF